MPEQTTLADLEAQALADLNADDTPADPESVAYFLALWGDQTPAEYYGEADSSSADPLP